jgi:hypothetical protein
VQLSSYQVSRLCYAYEQFCRSKQRLKQEQRTASSHLAAATIERQQTLRDAAAATPGSSSGISAAAAAADALEATAVSCGSNGLAAEVSSSDGDSSCSNEEAVVSKLEAVLAGTAVASDMQVMVYLLLFCYLLHILSVLNG